MSNKRAKEVLEHFRLNKENIKSRLSKLEGSKNITADAGNLARTVDHQVTELSQVRGEISDQKMSEVARAAQKRFSRLSKLLRDCASNRSADLSEARKTLGQGYEAIDLIGNLIHKKDEAHEKHHHAVRVKYKPKEQNEATADA